VYEFNSKYFFLSRLLFLGVILDLESSLISVNMAFHSVSHKRVSDYSNSYNMYCSVYSHSNVLGHNKNSQQWTNLGQCL